MPILLPCSGGVFFALTMRTLVRPSFDRILEYRAWMNPVGTRRVRPRFRLVHAAAAASLVTLLLSGCRAGTQPVAGSPARTALDSGAHGADVAVTLPVEPFTHAPQKPHDGNALVFTFDQLEHHYRIPGEYTHRLRGDEYGFEKLSFIITETHSGGGPGLHVHDVEEAHILLEGTALYRLGGETLTVHAPYVARVPAGVPHTFVNAGSEPFNLVAVFASNHPATTRVGPNPLIAPAK